MNPRSFEDKKAPLRGFFHVRPSLWAIAIVVVGLVGSIILGSRHSQLPTPVVKPDATELFIPKLISHVVKPGDTFAGILSLYGVPADRSGKLYESLVSLGFSCLFPGDSLVLAMTEEGNLLECNVLSGISCWYRMKVQDKEIVAEKNRIPVVTQQCVIVGQIESSLSESVNKMGVSDAVVSQFADIFAWDVNFFVDPQKGDTFRMVVERNYAGSRFVGYGKIIAAEYINQGKSFNAFGIADSIGAMHYFDENGKSLEKEFLKAPLRFNRISSKFSLHRRHPVLGIVRPHLGIDYAAPTGTPVYASADGVVAFAGNKGGFGKYVLIRHGGAYETGYGHLHSIGKSIRAGKRVAQGDCIGTVGSTGLSTGPHLDYRMQRNGRYINPLTLSAPSRGGIDASQQKHFELQRDMWRDLFIHRYCGVSGCFVFNVVSDLE